MSEQSVIPKLIECLKSDNHRIYIPALRALGNVMSGDDLEVITSALKLGFLDIID